MKVEDKLFSAFYSLLYVVFKEPIIGCSRPFYYNTCIKTKIITIHFSNKLAKVLKILPKALQHHLKHYSTIISTTNSFCPIHARSPAGT